MTLKPVPLIRRAGFDDAALLAELGARTFVETFAADNRPEDMAAYLAAAFGPEQQLAELTHPHSTFLIAEVDGVAAGYAKLHPGRTPESVAGERPIELVRLYVSRAWLGRGVGAALMRDCLGEARRAGYRTLWLGVWERNERARAFYRKWDFRDVGKHVFQLGDDPQTDILMERLVSEEIENDTSAERRKRKGKFFMSTPVSMHAARTALNRDPELRQWAEQWLKDKERVVQPAMTDEEFDKHWLYVRPERMHEGAIEAVVAYGQRAEGNVD